jgi:hypothetical protein
MEPTSYAEIVLTFKKTKEKIITNLSRKIVLKLLKKVLSCQWKTGTVSKKESNYWAQDIVEGYN